MNADSPRVPTIEDFGKWQFVTPIVEGLQRVITRDLMTAVSIPDVYRDEHLDPCNQFLDPIPVILAEDQEKATPYVILSFEKLTFASYESPKRLTETALFHLEVYVEDNPTPCGVLKGLRIVNALLRILFRVRARDFWAAQNPRSGVDATITVIDVKRLPASSDMTGRTRGLTQPYRIEFSVKFAEVNG